MTEYVVIYEQAEDGGWGAYLPDVPEVFALGNTREIVEVRVQEAIAVYLECVAEDGGALPVPMHEAGTVTA